MTEFKTKDGKTVLAPSSLKRFNPDTDDSDSTHLEIIAIESVETIERPCPMVGNERSSFAINPKIPICDYCGVSYVCTFSGHEDGFRFTHPEKTTKLEVATAKIVLPPGSLTGRCPKCQTGNISPSNKFGRYVRYNNHEFHIPGDVAIPTCDNCGFEQITDAEFRDLLLTILQRPTCE